MRDASLKNEDPRRDAEADPRRKTGGPPLPRREAAVLAGERAVLRRGQDADRREATADRREQAVRAMAAGARAGAQLREANERLVVATVAAQTMAEAAEQATAQMSHMAEHDFLTGLPNRSLLTARLAQSIALAQRHGKRVALLYLDLDHFKSVNDSLGHAIGDQLLRSAAKRLLACVRGSDTISRQGGDEFVVLLAEVEAARDAALAAEKLIAAMAVPHLIEGHRLRVTLSIGSSLYPDDGKDVDTVLKNADMAMYHAKKCGRDNYQAFTPDMNAQEVARQSVEEALHRALERRGWVLHYQPKVNLSTGAVAGVEALLRMRGVDDRLVYPARFVRVAEDRGLILPIGKWVLREACRQTSAWLRAGLDVGRIAVNVSAVEFESKGFVDGVRAILEDTGLDPSRLELELTESVLMRDTERTMACLRALKDLDVRIAVDDFGTGYSSLSYLRQFPIDTLKIDQSFVRDIEGEAGGAIVSAVIAMGLSLKHRVVAEGVETRKQLAFLRSRHCAEGQGYRFCRPVPAEEFVAWCAAAARPG